MNPLLALAEHRFISLTTFRRNGQAMSTPVWVGREGEALVVLTPASSGRSPSCVLTHGRRSGRADASARSRTVSSRSLHGPTFREHPDDAARARATIRRTYPIESRIVLGIERLVERVRGRPRTERLALHIPLVSA